MTKTRRNVLSITGPALAAIALPASAAGTALHCAATELRAVQAIIHAGAPAHLTGDDGDAYVAGLGDIEDAAYESVGRAPAQSLTELRVKIGLMLEAMGDRIGRRSRAGIASDAALAVLIAGTEADIARLIP